ncbi:MULTISPECIES: DUF262 domain-containing protein [Methanobacterium]|uniref:DUF262 domain-containing protein n=1 Tax=Methanobacterium veterum TaxID=408577 RepID=A0A9E4ZWK4_9EURY|nr:MULTISPECIES: DUF262 domain-containing protein [Methanobacterium]MCZ3366541.1 DUF262 domain-containing protein [Methanobacterium veterum]MCZ3371750.1 DUF262 domain-containing protein [Methanobacterium veterum]
MDELENLDEIEFEKTDDENIEDDIEPLRRKIYTKEKDPEIDSLYKRYKKGKLILQPDFQRHFIWNKSNASRLIESAILGIPLPIIYLSEEENNENYVIDGQQRLTSFFSFIDGEFKESKDKTSDFKLNGLKVLKELNGKRFSDLDEDIQDKIISYSVRTIIFNKESDKNLKFEIFERLNTGAISLNDQELRNCIYRGPYNILLKELSENKNFREILGIKNPERRMRDIELVLRFAAFYHATYLNYKPPAKQFLNREMEIYQNISDEESIKLKNAFKNSVGIIRSLFGDQAFRRFRRGDEKDPNGNWESRQFNKSLYEVLMFTFANADKNKVYKNLDLIREAWIDLMTNDQEFIDSIEISTNTIKAVRTRFDKWRNVLENIIDIEAKKPRCFSHELKKERFDANSTCEICGQRIIDIDDAALDHIEQYWQGGETVPENARLTHRYCNWSRSRNE